MPSTRLRFKTKLASWIILLLLGVSTVVQAGEIIENKSYKGKKTVVRWAFWGGESTVRLFKTVTERFVQEHPDIAVDVSIYPWGQYWSKLQTQVAAGIAPDVISMFGSGAGVWISHGVFQPLDKFMVRDGMDQSAYYKGALDAFRWDGKLYSFPIELAVGALLISVDKLEARGIPRDQWPRPDKAMTYEEYKSLARKLTLRDAQGQVRQIGVGSGGWFNDHMNGIWGGRYVDRQVNPTKPTILGNEALAKGLIHTFQDRFASRVQAPKANLTSLEFGGDAVLKSNLIAMAWLGPWVLPDYKAAGVRLIATPTPHGTRANQLFSANGVGIYSGAKNPEAAWKLVRFLASEFTQREIGRTLRGLPTLISAKEAFYNNEAGVKGLEAFTADMPTAESYICPRLSDIEQIPIKWEERMELKLGLLYDRKLAEWRSRKGSFREADHAAFEAEMNHLVAKEVRSALPAFHNEMAGAFKTLEKRPPTFTEKVLLPLLILLFLASAAAGYMVWFKRNQEPKAYISKPTWRQSLAGYAALSPWLAGFLCFTLGPMLASIYLSFTDWNMIKPPEWIGAQHYTNLFSDRFFTLGLQKTFTYAAWVIPISLIGGIFTAGLLTSDVRGSDAFKAIFYFPSLFTGAAATVLWMNMFHKEFGVVNHIIGFFGGDPVNWLDEAHAFTTVVLMNFFWVGGATIIYYAGMKQIPRSLYEAAEIDGAGAFRRFFSITIPMLSPVILFMVVMTTIGAFQVFTPALFFAEYAITIGGPGESLKFYSVNIYHEAFNNLRMGKASSWAVVLFVIIFAITMIQFKLSKKFVHSEA